MVHPRECGEQVPHAGSDRPRSGSSPRVRGTVPAIQKPETSQRFIPACAGNRPSALDSRFSYHAADVGMALEKVCWEVGYPKTIRVDQGNEFISHCVTVGLRAHDNCNPRPAGHKQ